MFNGTKGANEQTVVRDLYGQWKAEDRELESLLDEVRDWMKEVSKLGIPRFGETANRLQRLQRQLTLHFRREDEIGSQLEAFYPPRSAELHAAMRQADRDHRSLSERLGALVKRLDALEPPYSSWESATDDVELFLIALEQHEDQESESIETLIPFLADE